MLPLEFSGFSTNRHNRLYDAGELRQLMRDAGFEVEVCTSRSYSTSRRGLRRRAFEAAWGLRDTLRRLCTGRQIERGDYLFVRARKRGSVVERYPRWLYFDPQEWPDWFGARRQQSHRERPGHG